MNKIFIACPFIKYINETIFTDDAFRHFTEVLFALCEQYAPEVFLALKREEYGNKPMLRYSCIMDLTEMKGADLVIAIPEDSMGVAVELGWASALGKPIILLLNKAQRYTPLVSNINKITAGRVIWYEDAQESALPAIKDALEALG